jgi:hypothetical protein
MSQKSPRRYVSWSSVKRVTSTEASVTARDQTREAGGAAGRATSGRSGSVSSEARPPPETPMELDMPRSPPRPRAPAAHTLESFPPKRPN